jgi:hypothetical protein
VPRNGYIPMSEQPEHGNAGSCDIFPLSISGSSFPRKALASSGSFIKLIWISQWLLCKEVVKDGVLDQVSAGRDAGAESFSSRLWIND